MKETQELAERFSRRKASRLDDCSCFSALLCNEANEAVSEKANQRIKADGVEACRLLLGNWITPSR